MKQRHELLRVHIQQHSCDTNLTVEQLQEMVGSMSSIQQLLMNHLQRYATKVYWFRCEYQERGSTHAHGCAKLKMILVYVS